MSNAAIFDTYKTLVSFWGNLTEKNTEIALHSFSGRTPCIVNIYNGAITGRQIGDGFTHPEKDKVDSLIQTGDDYCIHFKGSVIPDVILHSSVCIIRGENGEAIGAVTVNTDITDMIDRANNYGLLVYMPDEKAAPRSDGSGTAVGGSVEDIIASVIVDLYGQQWVDCKELSMHEKIRIVECLTEKKVFLIKGAVGLVADFLSMSESSIYRYLKQLRKKQSISEQTGDA